MLYIILMYIFYFMFFANYLLLGVYFIFILDYGNNVSQKCKFKSFFYLSSKWIVM